MNSYKYFNKIKDCYNSMTDDLSKQIFMARLQYNMEPSLENADKFLSIADSNYQSRNNTIKNLVNGKKKIFFYGAGYYGIEFYNKFRLLNIELAGIFDKAYVKYNSLYDSLCDILNSSLAMNLSEKICDNIKSNYNISILPPPTKEWVELNTNEDYIICITTKYYFDEIKNSLMNCGISPNRIINLYDIMNVEDNIHYFEFMMYHTNNGAFIDAGCFDGATSVDFANISNFNYTNIYAFEPDEINLKLCNENIEFMRLNNMHLKPFGLGREAKQVKFSSGRGVGSHISDNGNITITITTIDDTIKDERVSFIKMDIEGAELDALIGAKNTIKRDKPLCAISIYHKPDDILTIIQYLKELVPEYKFKIRHYTMGMADTILYAYI